MKKLIWAGVIALAGITSFGGVTSASPVYPPDNSQPPEEKYNVVIDTPRCEYDADGERTWAVAVVRYFTQVEGIRFTVFTKDTDEVYYTTTKTMPGQWSKEIEWGGVSPVRAEIAALDGSFDLNYEYPGCPLTNQNDDAKNDQKSDSKKDAKNDAKKDAKNDQNGNSTKTLPKTGFGMELSVLGGILLLLGGMAVRLGRQSDLSIDAEVDR